MSERTGPSGRNSCLRTALLATLLVGSSADPAEPDRSAIGTETHTVTIAGMQFQPVELIVKRGSRIVWNNEDLFPHTVTAVDKSFDSGSIAAGSSWTYVATQPGTHAYVCGLHPTMMGRLVVR